MVKNAFKSSQAKKEVESEFPILYQRKNLSKRNKSERSVGDGTARTCKTSTEEHHQSTVPPAAPELPLVNDF